MANYIQLSRYFLDDKDIHDLVSGGGVSNRFLLEFLRRRGIFLPEPDKNWFREDLINEFSRQQFSWNDISEFNREITSADREEKVETCKLTGVVATVDIQALVMDLQTRRSTAKGEQYRFKKQSDSSVAIDVAYTEVDPLLARPFQKREKALDIEVQNINGEVSIRYSSNPRASQIVEVLSGLICQQDPKAIKSQRISFSGLKDPVLRSEFFTQLMDRVSGFRVIDVQDVRVDNRVGNDSEIEDGDAGIDYDAEEKETAAAVVKGLIKKAAFTGVSVLTSEIYNRLREGGYFITSLSWKSLELGSNHEVEFRAEMSDPVKFDGFKFDVGKITPLNADDELHKISAVLTKRKYVKRVEESAFAAKAFIDEKAASATPYDSNGKKD